MAACTQLYSQACCSGGTPLLGSLELPAAQKNNGQLMLTYNYNSLTDLIDNTRKLDDDTRKRTTHSFILESSYGINYRLSVTTIFSFIQQERRIFLAGQENPSDILTSNGIGDAMVLLKYNLLSLEDGKKSIVTLGAGPKFPIGSSTTTDNGILLPADMQSGTGAWDMVLWGYYYKDFLPKRFNFFATASFRLTGRNVRYKTLGDEQGYKFGNEMVAKLGTSYRSEKVLDYSLVFQYRSISPDEYTVPIPSTGGKWIDVVPGLNVRFKEQFAFRLSSELPFYRNLNGTQLTTTFKLLFSLLYKFETNKKEKEEYQWTE